MKALPANVIDVGFDADERDQELEALRAENRRLERAVADANVRASRAQDDANRALLALRRQLAPLYRALQMVFGELDAAGVSDVPSEASPQATPATDARVRAVWENWKQRFGGKTAAIIDALLLQPGMTASSLRIAVQCRMQTVYDSTSKLKQAGLIERQGDKYYLKQV